MGSLRIEDVEKLVRLVAETGLGEVEVRQADVRIRVSQRSRGEAAAPQVLASGMGPWPTAVLPAVAPSTAPATAGEAATARAAAEDDAGLHYLTASMVGTFYRRPNPEAAPFVKEGDVIQKGQVVCILEAMKILNEIESDVSGTVVKVLVADSQPVEFGERLLAVRPL